MNIKKWVFVMILGGFSSCSKKEDSKACVKDTECKGDRICENGKCIDPGNSITVKSPTPSSKPLIKAKPAKPQPSSPFKIPGLKGFPTTPNFNLPSILKNGLDLKLKLKSGKDNVSLQLKGIKNGVPVIELCKNGKCDVVNANDPSSFQKIFELLAGSGNDPMSKMFKDLMKVLKSQTPFKTPHPPSIFTPAPPKPTKSNPYRSWSEIQKDGKSAKGNQAILGGLKPVQITAKQVVFKTKNGNKIEVIVVDSLKSSLPALAKTSKDVIARFTITRINKKLIKGRLEEIEIPK
jgi:hypothetical protein